mgnify:FL=1
MNKKNILKDWLFFFIIISSSYSSCSQTQDFKFFVPINRYEVKAKKKLTQNDKFQNYKYFGNYYIDRAKKGIVNYSNVDEGLSKLIPNQKESTYLCVNIENKLYRNVRDLREDNHDFKQSLNDLIDLLKYIKQKRPNLKVGLYGVPYNFYYAIHKKRNSDKFLPLLKAADFISPHLYIHYPDKQKGQNANLNYLKENLQIALEYGKKLKKPVIPYVWYIVHPANKIYGGELITKPEMLAYLNAIQSYSHCGEKVKGVIWWEPSTTKYTVPKQFKGKIKSDMTKEEILLNYTEPFLNKKNKQ